MFFYSLGTRGTRGDRETRGTRGTRETKQKLKTQREHNINHKEQRATTHMREHKTRKLNITCNGHIK